MFSIVIHKATRAPLLKEAGLLRAQAIAQAGGLYDASKQFYAHGSLASGVSVLVMPDALAEQFVRTTKWPNGPLLDVEYQCGGW